jgi:hypothetical protein
MAKAQNVEAQNVPDSWVGEEITISFSSGSQRATAKCTLAAVNDRGVVVDYRGAAFFHPWNSIIAIQRGELQDTSRATPRSPGF